MKFGLIGSTFLLLVPLAFCFPTSSPFKYRRFGGGQQICFPCFSFQKMNTALRISNSAYRCLTVCSKCRGEGRIRRPPSRKARIRHKRAKMNAGNDEISIPPPPPPRWEPCSTCQSTGLMKGEAPAPRTGLQVAIIGGGIGGLALGVALKHRGIPFTIYERDEDFSQRRQGYGLTMQQASKALKSFGITSLPEGVTSTKHVVHTTDGNVVGEWGLRKWRPPDAAKLPPKESKRQNIHIARQSLRRELLEALGGDSQVQWGCQLEDYIEEDDKVQLTFRRGSKTFTTAAGLLVGADGIRSTVRKIHLGSEATPLRYLGCLVVLGICPRQSIQSDSPLLDGETVFQTADGILRLYVMPFSPDAYMWQLSFPLDEDEAKSVSCRGAEALKQEAIRLCGEWHEPIPELLKRTQTDLVSGYPVYDRDLLTSDLLSSSRVTLLGDAAHPMSPFKVCVSCLKWFVSTILSLTNSSATTCTFLPVYPRAKEPIRLCWTVFP